VNRRFSPMLLAFLLAAPTAVMAQEPAPPPQSEEERLEQDYIRTRIENGESHASGSRPDLGPVVLGNPTQAVVALRVGLHFSTVSSTGALTEFARLHHPYVELRNTDGDVKVINRETGKEIAVMTPGSLVRVEHNGADYVVSQDGTFVGSYAGPVYFRPTSRANQFRVESVRRSFGGTKVPLYRGAIEVARGAVTSGVTPVSVNLVNVIEVEDYVPGVVANESIASFSVEALKAQAVAARGYAIANVGNYVARGYPFDIVDSSASQVYRGVISEHVNAVQAATATRGLVASHSGRIISALYSSSFGGHSEDNEWIFNFPSSSLPGTNALPYLRGIFDGVDPAPDFTSEAGIDAFWRTNPLPQIHDDCLWTGNGFSRWRFVLPAATIRGRLTGRSVVTSGNLTGNITNVEIVRRMTASARAAVVRVALTTGVAEVRGWDNLRNVFGRTGAAGTPRACGTNVIAANFTLNNPSSFDLATNVDGTLRELTVYGGGWGHNLGMSQFGAHGRGKAGQGFIQILQAYYTGADIGSYPIDIGREPGAAPTLRQQFVATRALGTLEIRATDLAGLRVHLNDLYDLSFDEATLAAGVVRVDVSAYLVAGLNVIQYNPVGREGRATVTVLVR
jgi:stage II sporulation protein D